MPEVDEKRERLRLRARTDHLWLANEVLGYDFQEVPHRGLFNCYLQKQHSAVSHIGMAGAAASEWQPVPLFELDQVKARLILWPRGAFKTTGSAVEMTQLILEYPDIRIGVLSSTLAEAKKRVTEAKQSFLDSRMRKLFPEYCFPENAKAECSKFTSPARKRKHLREATVEVLSPRAIKAGKHFDVIFVDDLVNELNSKNKEQLLKSIENYRSFIPLLDPGGYLFVTGTRYSFDDAYGYILEQVRDKGLAHWKVSIRTCWIERCKCGCPDAFHLDGGGACNKCNNCAKFEGTGSREVLFPQAKTEDGRTIGHTVETLEAIRADIGDEDFACQYLNDPLAGGARTFTRELLYSHILHEKAIPKLGPVIIFCDLAYSLKNESDQTVFMVARVVRGRNYIIHCVCDRMDPYRQAEELLIWLLRFRPRMIYVEKCSAAEYLKTIVTMLALKHSILHVPLEVLQADNRKNAKFHRISAVQGALKADRLYFMLGLPHWSRIEEQFLKFPKKQRHDDLADTVGHVVKAPTGYEMVPLPEQSQLPWFLTAGNQQAPAMVPGEVAEAGSGLPFGING